MENKSIQEDKRNVEYFIKTDSILQKEISLFKIYLTPLELYILKLFMANPSPKTTMDVKKNIVEVIWESTFDDGTKVTKDGYDEKDILDLYNKHKKNLPAKMRESPVLSGSYLYSFLLNMQLVEEGYSINSWKSKKTNKAILYFEKFKSSEMIKQKEKILKKEGIKIPSFELLKSLIEGLTELGFFMRRSRERNIVFYTFNPKFYLIFKEKANEILSL